MVSFPGLLLTVDFKELDVSCNSINHSYAKDILKKMYYLIAKIFNESGSIALKTTRGKGLTSFADKFQEKIGYNIQLVTITRFLAYGEYEPYHFANSYEEFEKEVNSM